MKKKMPLRSAVIAVVLLCAAALLFYRIYSVYGRPQESTGEKTIELTVDHLRGEDTHFTIVTEETYLRGALEQEGLVQGSESDYGLWVETVDGETADSAKQEWWGYEVNGEYAQYGVDSQPVTDGDRYVFTLHVGW